MTSDEKLKTLESLPDDDPNKQYFLRLIQYYTEANDRPPSLNKKKELATIVFRKDKELRLFNARPKQQWGQGFEEMTDLRDQHGRPIDLSRYDNDDNDDF